MPVKCKVYEDGEQLLSKTTKNSMWEEVKANCSCHIDRQRFHKKLDKPCNE